MSAALITPELKLKFDTIVARYPADQKQSAVIPLLHLMQESNAGSLTQAHQQAVADFLSVPMSKVHEVTTFYTMYSLEQRGKKHISVCGTLPCALKGCDSIVDALSHELGVGPGQVTPDNWGNLILPWQPNYAIKTEGLDFSANYIIPMDEKYGKITLTGVANYILSYELQTSKSSQFHEFGGMYTGLAGLMPDYNITTSLTYELGGFSYTISAHYLPKTFDPGLTHPEYGEAEHGSTLDGKTWEIPSYFTIDMQVAYEFGKGKVEGRKWYDGTRVAVGCQNITGEEPPLIPDAVEDNTDKNNYDIIGQFVYFEVSKKF